MARRWEHDGKDLSTAPRRANGEVDWARVKHRHNFIPDGPFVGSQFDRDWVGISGQHCNMGGCPERDERPVCVETIMDNYVSHRCWRVGIVVRPEPNYPDGDSRNPPRYEGPEGSGWWYCGQHDPVARKARQEERDAAYRAKRAPIIERQRAQTDLLAEVVRWRDDERLVGEPFCDDDCEHHACRLARAVARYERTFE